MNQNQHWSAIKERGSERGIQILVFIYKVFGKGLFQVCLYPVMVYFYLTGTIARRSAIDYWTQLEITRGTKTSTRFQKHRHAYRMFITFGLLIVDKFDAWLGKIKAGDIEVMHQNCVKSLMSSGGVVILSSHLGNMELCRAIFSYGDRKKNINVITYNQHAPSFNNVLKKINPNAAVNFIHINNFGPSDTIHLKQKIEEGEAVVIFADRTSVANPNSVIHVPFLSKPAPFAIGPFALATVMDCPVFFMTCLKNSESGRYQAYVEEFAMPVKVPRKDRNTHYQQMMERYASRLTHYCMKEPYQWNNFFDFWPAKESGVDNNPDNKQDKVGAS